MGIGMQMVYVGFPGSPAIEAEAGVQLLRLDRFSSMVAECLLAIECLPVQGQPPVYEARLELTTVTRQLHPVRHCESADPRVAVRAAFDAAERELSSHAVAASAVRRRGR